MDCVHCVNCGRDWRVRSDLSLYERQELESRPCPGCAAYTLSCVEGKAVGRVPRGKEAPLQVEVPA